jgi:CubicO group peptidase (beta-lactamase class C family)
MSAETLASINGRSSPSSTRQNPGFVTLVARNGKIVHLEAVGPRDVENSLPMETDTIFRMYSMTKPVTAVAVMQLVDAAESTSSDPVSDYIPEFANLSVLVVHDDGSHELVPSETPMTVQHLLTHTSGLSYGLFNPVIQPYYEEAGIDNFTDLTLEEFARAAASAPLLNEPGAAWNYSISMDILGRIVEVAPACLSMSTSKKTFSGLSAWSTALSGCPPTSRSDSPPATRPSMAESP